MRLFIDTHLHIYPEYDVSLLLDSALSNFKSFSPNDSKSYFVLALSERFDCNFFKEHQTRNNTFGHWNLVYKPESELIESTYLDSTIYILPGRQNISSERLEILTLGSDSFRAERLPAVEIIKGSNETGLITILPWSLGKWMGKRGNLVRRLIEDSSLDFFLGDPAHRIGATPKLFLLGERNSRSCLRGTDLLPLPNEEKRAGSYGNAFEFKNEELTLKNIIKTLTLASTKFGDTIGALSGIRLQAMLRLKR